MRCTSLTLFAGQSNASRLPASELNRYADFRMNENGLLIFFALSLSVWSGCCLAQNTYQINFIAEDTNNELRIGIDGAYQKALNKSSVSGGYLYDFGVFVIHDVENIDIKLFSYNREQRRVRLVPQHSSIRPCKVSACGDFKFIKTQSPATSFSDQRDICNNLGMGCPRGGYIQ